MATRPGKKPAAMTWEKSSPSLAHLFETLVPADAGVQIRQMFGWPCCFVNGNLCAGLHKQSMIFRLSDDELREFLKLAGASEFEPMPGRKMKGYGLLSDPLNANRALLADWLSRSLRHVRALPPKNNKTPKKRAKKLSS